MSRAKRDYTYKVYVDNQASLYRLASPSDQPGQSQHLRVLRAYRATIAKGASMSFHWVPGHMDILGNELADTLAKQSTLEVPESREISLAYLGSRLRSLNLEAWGRFIESQKDPSPDSYKATYSLKPKTSISLPKVGRALASAFYQLKIGHGYYKDYLYRLGHSSSKLCLCGKRETPRHLILGCPRLAGARSKLKDSLGTSRLTLPLLLETRRGVEGTLNFLKTTGILTRKWYIQRLEEANIGIRALG
jgi:hypothetical protein